MPAVNCAVPERRGAAPSKLLPCRGTTECMSALPQAVNLAEKFSLFTDHWQPRVVGELNGQHVKLVKLLGEFVWHKHDREDELFLVVRGRFRMEFRDREVWLDEGEFLIVPRGVEHRPVAPEEAH